MPSTSKKYALLLVAGALVLPALFGCASSTPTLPTKVLWTEQFGTSAFDDARAVAVDEQDNVLVVGHTEGDLAAGGAGSFDAYVSKFASDGAVTWTRQFGTAAVDGAYVVATDSDGNVFVAGYTFGDLAEVSGGASDPFVRKYDTAGAVIWTRQFGTASSEDLRGLATDAAGNVYLAGSTSGDLEGVSAGGFDVFVRKYKANGDLDWTHQFGTNADDGARGLTVDAAGFVVVTGFTKGNLDGISAGNSDVFVRKLSAAGAPLWTHQFGSDATDSARGVVTDSADNIIVTGHTSGGLAGGSAGDKDVYLRKLDADGNPLWTRQFGTSSDDRPGGVAVDSKDNVIVAGYTEGALHGPSAGEYDAFVRRYTPSGEVEWAVQFGTAGSDRARGVATDSTDNIAIAGESTGNLGSGASGDLDAFVRLYAP